MANTGSFAGYRVYLIYIIRRPSQHEHNFKTVLTRCTDKELVTKVKDILKSIPEAQQFHHLHLWLLDGESHVLTVHINLRPSTSLEKLKSIRQQVSQALSDLNLSHTTIQFDIEAFFGAESDDMDGIIGRVDENLSFIQERFGYLGLLFDQHLGLIRKLSPILRDLTFDEKESDPEIILAIDWFKKYSIAFEEDTPVSFLKKNELESLELEDETPKISKWKILLFCYVIEGIRTKKLTLQYSFQHKTDESYLISSSEWLKNMGEYIKAAKMEAFTNAESVVNQIGKKPNKQYSTLNDLIDEEGVEGFRRTSSHWSLQGLDPNFVESKFIPTLLSEEKPAMLIELLTEVDKYSNFTSALRHTHK